MATQTHVGLALVVGIAVGALGYAGAQRLSQREEPAQAGDVPSSAVDPATASLPEIPISLNYVEARTGLGYVVQFHNQSQKHLAVLVELENKTLGQKRSGPLQLAPGQMIELGGTREWTFVSGETVVLKLDGHQPKTFQVP